jgi:hypothetical protein
MKPAFTLILKPNKDITRKGNYKPISLMNVDAKFPQNTRKQIQQRAK